MCACNTGPVYFRTLYIHGMYVQRNENCAKEQKLSLGHACIIHEHVLQTFKVFTCTRNINHWLGTSTNINVMFLKFPTKYNHNKFNTKQGTNF